MAGEVTPNMSLALVPTSNFVTPEDFNRNFEKLDALVLTMSQNSGPVENGGFENGNRDGLSVGSIIRSSDKRRLYLGEIRVFSVQNVCRSVHIHLLSQQGLLLLSVSKTTSS